MINSGIKKTLIILFIVTVLGALIGALAFNKKSSVSYSTEKIKRENIMETVSETGTVKAQNKIDLNFLNSGKIAKINVQLGNKVVRNDILAELDYEALNIKKNEARASIDVARANLNKLLSGATAEDIAISESQVKQAKTAYESSVKEYDRNIVLLQENLEQAEKTLNDLLDSSSLSPTTYEQSVLSAKAALENTKLTYQKSIDNYKESYTSTLDDKLAVCNSALNLIDSTINDDDLENILSVKNKTYLESTKIFYDEASSLLEKASLSLEKARSDNSNENAIKAINDFLSALSKTFDSLSKCYSALKNTITSSSLTSTELEAYKSSIDAEQLIVSTAVSALQTLKQNLEGAILNYNTNVSSAENSLAQAQAAYDSAVLSAQNVLSTADLNNSKQATALQSKADNAFEAWQLSQNQLEKVKAPANSNDLSLARAQLKQSQAALDSISKQIDDSILRAPVDGIISEINYEVGEQYNRGQAVISLILESNFKIEVLVSEADIAKLSLNDLAEISLDAFGDAIIFKGSLTFIEPAETIIQDVVYYKTTVHFLEKKDQANPSYFNKIKPGMTANVIINTDKRSKVLVIPFRAIIDKGEGGKFTRVLKNNIPEERKINIGLKGDGGLIEIISGLKEGEEVVTYVSEK